MLAHLTPALVVPRNNPVEPACGTDIVVTPLRVKRDKAVGDINPTSALARKRSRPITQPLSANSWNSSSHKPAKSQFSYHRRAQANRRSSRELGSASISTMSSLPDNVRGQLGNTPLGYSGAYLAP